MKCKEEQCIAANVCYSYPSRQLSVVQRVIPTEYSYFGSYEKVWQEKENWMEGHCVGFE